MEVRRERKCKVMTQIGNRANAECGNGMSNANRNELLGKEDKVMTQIGNHANTECGNGMNSASGNDLLVKERKVNLKRAKSGNDAAANSTSNANGTSTEEIGLDAWMEMHMVPVKVDFDTIEDLQDDSKDEPLDASGRNKLETPLRGSLPTSCD